jgi:hypothetical protein
VTFGGDGSWQVGGTGGTNGYVLTSTGNTTAPTWQAAGGGGGGGGGAASALNGTSAYSATPQDTTGVYAGTSGSVPRIFFTNTAAATGRRNSQVYNNGTSMVWTFINDTNAAETAWLSVALPTNNASQQAPAIQLNTPVLSLFDGSDTVTITTPNVSGAANTIILTAGQNTVGTGAAAFVAISGALRNNAGVAGQASIQGGQNSSTGAAGDVVVAGGNQTGSATGVGGNTVVYGGAGGASGAGGYISFNTGAANILSERMRITNAGALTFAGVTGTGGQVLTSNASGVPSWQDPAGGAAGALTGTTLAPNVVTSSLTSVGTLTDLTVSTSTGISITPTDSSGISTLSSSSAGITLLDCFHNSIAQQFVVKVQATGGAATVERLRVNSAGITVTGTVTETSTIRVKENIRPLEGALEKVMGLRGIVYDMKDHSASNQIGLIAEEVHAVVPNVVYRDEDGEIAGVQYARLVAVLIEGMKTQEARIQALEATIAAMKA